MQGYALLAHTVAGGALAVAIAGYALTGAAAHRRRARPSRSALQRATFPAVLLFGLLGIGTILASTFPLLGTEALLRVIDLHRFSGLGLVVVMALHSYGSRVGKAEHS
jgi:hypothetical protein